uniref:Polyprotein n=1 Tax=Peronospora matthiolae TaxID=2874970 RepID=A0AAV1T174_9STRA
MRVSLLERLNLTRIDYMRQAEELADFAQSTEIDLRGKNIGKDVVNTVGNGRRAYFKTRTHNRKDRRDMRTCYICGKPGHLKIACPEGSAETRATDEVDFVLAIGGSSVKEDYWILDSGSSRHLDNDASLLEDPENTSAKNLEKYIISYGLLESKGCGISYRGEYRVLVALDEGPAVFDVGIHNNVLVVRAQKCELDMTGRDVLMSALAQYEEDVGQDVQKGSLKHFFIRLAHLNYDNIIRMAKDPVSGIQLTDELRANCLACDQGKQTKNPHSRKDTIRNAPIEVIGGVTCSDLKGPMTPRDMLGNRYMVNFIDHQTNYCRILLAKVKDAAAQKFKHFMAFFERQFNCRIHVLRTDGGGEYKTLELFCKDTGIAHQVSEPRN